MGLPEQEIERLEAEETKVDKRKGLSKHTDEIERLYFEVGEPMQAIGDRYGVSREAVRQFLNRHFPERIDGRKFRKEVRETERLQAEEAELEKRKAHAPPCAVCGDLVLRSTGGRGKHRTCSPTCSKLWASARFLLDAELRERQRQSMARSILKYNHTHSDSSVEWAKKIINGEPVNTRTFTVRNSRARLAYDQVMAIREEKGYHPQ